MMILTPTNTFIRLAAGFATTYYIITMLLFEICVCLGIDNQCTF
jgi:hypothetical protein